jgi:cytochrome o ubiquinol oxidase subunit 3
MNPIPSVENDKNLFGFWIYLMTDCVLFASLFATFAVLRSSTFGGPSGSEIFNLPFVLTETIILLTSSFTCGLGMLAAQKNDRRMVLAWFGLTFLLGLAFLILEIHEFRNLVAQGDSWRRSGFLTSFFTLVGTHGAHITIGLTWMAALLIRIWRTGLNSGNLRKLTALSYFWHFLDVVWIFIFTIVYLLGFIG